MIEKAVKDFHLKADLMFPKADVKLLAFIENIASMGGYTSIIQNMKERLIYDFYLFMLGTIFAVVIRQQIFEGIFSDYKVSSRLTQKVKSF